MARIANLYMNRMNKNYRNYTLLKLASYLGRYSKYENDKKCNYNLYTTYY